MNNDLCLNILSIFTTILYSFIAAIIFYLVFQKIPFECKKKKINKYIHKKLDHYINWINKLMISAIYNNDSKTTDDYFYDFSFNSDNIETFYNEFKNINPKFTPKYYKDIGRNDLTWLNIIDDLYDKSEELFNYFFKFELYLPTRIIDILFKLINSNFYTWMDHFENTYKNQSSFNFISNQTKEFLELLLILKQKYK